MMQRIGLGVVVSILAIAGAAIILSFIGAAIEGVTDWQVEHERCLKRAPNAYEAGRCR